MAVQHSLHSSRSAFRPLPVQNVDTKKAGDIDLRRVKLVAATGSSLRTANSS